MADYDFKALHDKEFEVFCADLLSEVEGRRFERFKAGRDGGVDGRYFASNGSEVVLQCKHWAGTPIRQLLRALEQDEKPKLDKLKPGRYLLAVSLPLSRTDKKHIQQLLAPHLAAEDDIYGSEDLNDLLRAHPHIERIHYKLWMHSASVLKHIFNNAILGRSAFSLEEIINSSAKYVVTANHEAALIKLEKLGVVIITGEPGVGKTTLADHLCLHYVAQGYAYIKIADDIREAESEFDPDTKQIVYFDDFLGRNYLDALRGHEGAHITQFLRRIAANKNKRFVLTSRSTILNQGKLLIDALEHNNVQRNEFELRIQSLSDLDRAQILYNHIWHSGLAPAYVEQLYVDRRYRKIIDHKNFNPRLISYVTDATRLDDCPPHEYWNYILQSLTNPSHVWENPFVAQLDDFSRAIVYLVVFHGASIGEGELSAAYHRFVALPENQSFHGRREFQSNIRLLTGSFLNRTVSNHGQSNIDLFNPSIADYVLRRSSGDIAAICLVMLSLRSYRSTITLMSLKGGLLSNDAVSSICETLISNLVKTHFEGASVAYVAAIFELYRSCPGFSNADIENLQAAVLFCINQESNEATDDSFAVVEWAIEHQIVMAELAMQYVAENIEAATSKYELRALSSLLSKISEDTRGYESVSEAVREHALEVVSDCFTEFIDVDDAFSRVDYGDDQSARHELERLVESELDDLGIRYSADDISRVMDAYDVDDGLYSYFENSYDGDDRREEAPRMLAFDEIDDLFDRG